MPKSLRTIFDPQKPWPMGAALRHNLLFMSCFLGHGPPCEGPPLPKTTLCGTHRCVVWCVVVVLCCVVVWCVGAVCVQNFRGCVENLGAPPTPLRRTPSPDSNPSAGPPKISLFFSLSRHNFLSFFSLFGVLSLNFGGVFEGREKGIYTFGLSGCRGPPGLHTTTRELQTCTFQGPGASNTTKIPRKDPKKREERKKIVVVEGKKARNFGPFRAPPFRAPPFGPHFFQVWACTLRSPHPSGTNSPGPHTSGPPHFGTPAFGTPAFGDPPRDPPPPDSQQFRPFFPLPLPFSLFFSLGVFSWNFGGV